MSHNSVRRDNIEGDALSNDNMAILLFQKVLSCGWEPSLMAVAQGPNKGIMGVASPALQGASISPPVQPKRGRGSRFV
jgi:hypothetical protein